MIYSSTCLFKKRKVLYYWCGCDFFSFAFNVLKNEHTIKKNHQIIICIHLFKSSFQFMQKSNNFEYLCHHLTFRRDGIECKIFLWKTILSPNFLEKNY
jgi:hypothetical protein